MDLEEFCCCGWRDLVDFGYGGLNSRDISSQKYHHRRRRSSQSDDSLRADTLPAGTGNQD